MTKKIVLVALVVSGFIALPGTSMSTQEFVYHEYGFAMSLPDDWAVSSETTDVVAVYDLPVLKYYEMVNSAKTMFIQMYFLNNLESLPLTDFLTEPRAGGIVVIDWHQETIGGRNMVQVGYEYDPPFLGFLEAEILHMIDTPTSAYLYLQFGATVGTPYADILESIVQSFETAVANEQLTFGQVRCLYR